MRCCANAGAERKFDLPQGKATLIHFLYDFQNFMSVLITSVSFEFKTIWQKYYNMTMCRTQN